MDTLNAPLMDRFGRRLEYLRLAVTDRCDMKCSYCMPKGFKGYEEPSDWLSFDEVERLVRLFAARGVSRIRLTGGEPLLRRGLPDLVARLSALPGVHDLSMTTNATHLATHAKALRRAGLSRLNVSLDSLSRECLAKITGLENALDKVREGLWAAREVGFSPIKLNMVVIPGVNDHEIEAMAWFCLENGFVLRLIETMPMGHTGQALGFVPLEAAFARLKATFGLIPEIRPMGGGPARYWRTPDGRGQIGFITPMSQHFCATCNRVRLGVQGTLYLCLGQEDRVELGALLRSGAPDHALMAELEHAITMKPERHEFREIPQKIMRFMSQTGG
jgi:GTP 3',8-cyclase